MSERGSGEANRESLEDLPVLVSRLGDDLVTLLDSKLGLLKVEVREDAIAYLRGSASIAVGAVVATVGFALLNVAIAFFVVHALAGLELAGAVRYGLGFLLVGATYVLIGLVLAKRAQHRLAAVQPSPSASVRELRKDGEWLAGETRKD